MYIICVNLDSCHQINLTGCAKVFIFYMNRAKVFQGHAAFFREKGKSPEIPVTNQFPLAWFVFIHTLVVYSGQSCITVLFSGKLL